MKTFLFRAFLLTAFVSPVGATATFAQALAAANKTTPVGIPQTVDRAKMLQLVNAVRSKGCQCGDTYYYPVPPIVWNTQLETAAYGHSADMAKNKYFSHAEADGSRAGARLD